MGFLLTVLQWLGDPAHWRGSDGIPTRIAEEDEGPDRHRPAR